MFLACARRYCEESVQSQFSETSRNSAARAPTAKSTASAGFGSSPGGEFNHGLRRCCLNSKSIVNYKKYTYTALYIYFISLPPCSCVGSRVAMKAVRFEAAILKWGNHFAGQLGVVPVEEDSEGLCYPLFVSGLNWATPFYTLVDLRGSRSL